jgi:hypothetical protein
MKIDQIHDLWSVDCAIDQSQLEVESLRTPSLHHKYYKILIQENLRLKKYQMELSSLRHDKEEFYSDGPNETTPPDWEFPAKGKIMRGARPDLESYLNADREIQKKTLEISVQAEKVKFLESIIDTLNRRTFVIKNAIDFLRFTNGGQ